MPSQDIDNVALVMPWSVQCFKSREIVVQICLWKASFQEGTTDPGDKRSRSQQTSVADLPPLAAGVIEPTQAS